MSEKKHILYYDVLNIAACIAVISLHHNGIVHTFSDSVAWKTALIVEVVAYWAVPVFLMLTGATLMNYREKYSTATFFRKRLIRTVVPFLAWSAIVLIWKLSTGQFSFSTGDWKEVVSVILNNKMENVYWYFPFLFSIYLLMPLLSWLTEPRHRRTLWYGTLVMFVTQSTLPPLCQLMGISWNTNLSFPIHSYLIFVFLGYLLSTADFSKSARYMIYAAGTGGAIFRYVAIYTLSMQEGAKNTLFFNYAYFPSVLLACAIFVWAKSVNWERVLRLLHCTPKRLSSISACSLGVYLVHRIVMYYEQQWMASLGITTVRLIWRIAFIPVTYIVALVIVRIIKRIPVFRKLVP